MHEATQTPPDVLIVDDEGAILSVLKAHLAVKGLTSETLNSRGMSVETVAAHIRNSTAQIVSLDGEYVDGTAKNVLDESLSTGKNFLVLTGNDSIAAQVRSCFPSVPVIIKCTPKDIPNYIATIRGFMSIECLEAEDTAEEAAV